MWRHLSCSSSMVDWDMLHCLFWREWAWIQMGQQRPAPSPSTAAVAWQRQRDAVVMVGSAHCHKAESSFSTSHILFIFPPPSTRHSHQWTVSGYRRNSSWMKTDQCGGKQHWKSNDGRGSGGIGKCGGNGSAATSKIGISEGNSCADDFRTILCLFLSVICSSKAVSIIRIAACTTRKYKSAEFHLCFASQSVSCQSHCQAASRYRGKRYQ